MKEIFKVDEYKIFERGKEYSILVFPVMKHMVAYYDFDMGYYSIDGLPDTFKLLKYACAILIRSPDKIIYFPSKYRNDGIENCYPENLDFVLYTQYNHLHKPSWINIRNKINKKNWVGKYKLRYDRKKLEDYFIKFLSYYDHQNLKYRLTPKLYKKLENMHFEKLYNETVFMAVCKEELYLNHYRICKDMDEYMDSHEFGEWTGFGYMLSSRNVERVLEELKEKECL